MLKKEIGTRLGLAAVSATIALFAISGTSQALQCKPLTQVGVGQSPLHAQQVWTTTVAGKFGPKWAHWVGAKNKVIVPINGGNLYHAAAKPCFYQPVL